MEFNFDRPEQRASLDPRAAEVSRNTRNMAGDHATPAGEGMGRIGRGGKKGILPVFELDRLEARVLRSGPAARPASTSTATETPQLFLYGIDSSEPVYAWDPKKKVAKQDDATGPSVPFRLREAMMSMRDMTKEPLFNRIVAGDVIGGTPVHQAFSNE
mmetsp:Transcript_40160/g.126462  ORF Transcript_40160/g.126462 Transcript_40160/m.126462 type:complete len:158 (-) Transcript_40160:50-523(-)